LIESLLLSFLLSCKSQGRITRATPVQDLPVLQQSVINIPFTIYAKPFLARAEAAIPLEFTSPGWPEFLGSGCDFRYKYRFVRSGFRFSCVNNKATLIMMGHYQLAGSRSVCAFGRQVSPWINGSCGFSPEPMRRVEISIRSALTFQPDYTLRSRSALEKIAALDKCTVTLMNTDITGMVTDNIRSAVNSFAASFDQSVSSVNYSSLITKAAILVGKKLPLGSYGFIKINPAAVNVGDINYANDTMYLTAGFSCSPEISSDPDNGHTTTVLPPLSRVLGQPGFIIHTNASYKYGFIDNLLTRFVKNKPFEVKGKNFIIQQVRVRGLENNKVEISLEFTGQKAGTLYLTGTPVLDTFSQVIQIPDLDYSLKSADIMLALGKTFFNKKILRNIRKKSILRIADIYLQNKNSIDSALNRKITPVITSTGKTEQVKLTGLVVKKDRLLFQVSAIGTMAISVK
jgi:hypothetical protein